MAFTTKELTVLSQTAYFDVDYINNKEMSLHNKSPRNSCIHEKSKL